MSSRFSRGPVGARGFMFLAFFCLSLAGISSAQDRKPAFLDPVIRLAANHTRDVTIVRVQVNGLTKEELALTSTPVLTDATDSRLPGKVAFSFVRAEDVGPAGRIWYFNAEVDDLPLSQTQKRKAEIKFGDIDEKLDYTLSNQATAASAWTILPPPDPWVVSGFGLGAHCAAISIIPGDAAATNLTLQQSTLVEQSATKQLLGLDHLKLCRDDTASDCGTFDLPPHFSGPPLYLCIDGRFHSKGNFRGNLTLSALEKPETQSVVLDIYVSSFWAKLMGFVLILLGVVLAWVTKVYATNRLTRDQELIPVTLLRSRLQTLQGNLTALPAAYHNSVAGFLAEINDLLENVLTVANLDANHYIHPASPTPLNTFTVDSAGYKSFLGDRDGRVNLLTVLVAEGIKPAIQMASRGAAQANIRIALDKVEALRSQNPALSEAQARANITQQILPALAGTIVVAAGLATFTTEFAPPVSFDHLLVEISGINALVWGVSGLLTALVGFGVLILNNPGFGTPLDYVYCLFWGFGIPTAIQQLNSGSAASSLGITVPKS